jgi:hypothetical protein
MPIHCARGQVESTSNLRDGHADEVAHPYHFCGLRNFQRQGRERVVDGQQFLGRHGHGDAGFVQFVADQVGAMFEPLFAPGVVDKDLLHRRGGRLEEMPAIGEVLVALSRDLQPGLMHECGGLQGLSGFLIRHPDDSELAQLLINKREQLIGGLGVTLLNAVEDACDVAHALQSRAAATAYNSKQFVDFTRASGYGASLTAPSFLPKPRKKMIVAHAVIEQQRK